MNAHRDEPATKKDLDLVRKDLDQVKQVLTDKIEANGRKIEANSAKIDQVEQGLTAKIDANGKKIDRVEQRLTAKIDVNSTKIDRLIRRALENSERLDKMLTEEKFKVYFNEIMNSIDGLAKVVSHGEQERAATNSRIDRVEGDVETNKSKIKKIETKLAMDP